MNTEEYDAIPGKKKRNRKSFREIFRSLKPGAWLWQLSVVVVGILITFKGTDIVNSSQEKKELRHMLEMVREELLTNIAILDYMQGYNMEESRGMGIFAEYADKLRAMPTDSLEKHMSILGRSSTTVFSKTAMEVFKNSSAPLTMRNKSLLQFLYLCYESLDDYSKNNDSYYLEKRRIANDFLYSLDKRTLAKLTEEGDPYPYLEAYMNNPGTRNFMFNSGNIINMISREQSVRAMTVRTLENIEKELGR